MQKNFSRRPTAIIPITQEQLFLCLQKLDIQTTTYDHQPVFTVQQSHTLRQTIPGEHCKSLFLKDKKQSLVLVVVREHVTVDLKIVQKLINVGRLSFGSEALLWKVLGVYPGSVTPFALLNDQAHQMIVVLEKEMLSCGYLNYHPLINTQTTTIQTQDFLKFIRFCGHEPKVLALET